VALLLLAQQLAQGQQFIEQFLDASAAGVVILDQLLELFGKIRPGPVELDELLQLRPDGDLEYL
jgi:hypothetical protein